MTLETSLPLSSPLSLPSSSELDSSAKWKKVAWIAGAIGLAVLGIGVAILASPASFGVLGISIATVGGFTVSIGSISFMGTGIAAIGLAIGAAIASVKAAKNSQKIEETPGNDSRAAIIPGSEDSSLQNKGNSIEPLNDAEHNQGKPLSESDDTAASSLQNQPPAKDDVSVASPAEIAVDPIKQETELLETAVEACASYHIWIKLNGGKKLENPEYQERRIKATNAVESLLKFLCEIDTKVNASEKEKELLSIIKNSAAAAMNEVNNTYDPNKQIDKEDKEAVEGFKNCFKNAFKTTYGFLLRGYRRLYVDPSTR